MICNGKEVTTVVRDLLRRNPSWRRHLRLCPPAVRWAGRWRRIRELRSLGYVLEVLCEGRVRLRLPDDIVRQEAWDRTQRRLLSLLGEVLSRQELIAVGNARTWSRPPLLGVEQRIASGGTVLACLASTGKKTLPAGTVVYRLLQLWDRRSGARLGVIVIPKEYGERAADFLQHVRIPVSAWTYSPGRKLTRIFPRPRSTEVGRGPYVLYPYRPRAPSVLQQALLYAPGCELRFRAAGWELCWRGLPVLWGAEESGFWFDRLSPRRLEEAGWETWKEHVRRVLEVRSWPSPDPASPYFRLLPERWLEGELIVRLAGLFPGTGEHLYCQVPSLVEGERRIIDLLTCTPEGRVIILELKAGRDPAILFQGLEYWDRVRRHLQEGDFERAGYFPGVALSRKPPLLVLVTPLFEFHRCLPRLRRFLSEELEVECLGVNLNWRSDLRILRRFVL
ncbi:MAG TPA: hypothetical protein P5568_11840 [Acidobacteriota bacterium]|nr:hypothetical protein [Acidobacteriota bacterium]